MKKITAFIMSILIVFSMTACGAGNTDDSAKSDGTADIEKTAGSETRAGELRISGKDSNPGEKDNKKSDTASEKESKGKTKIVELDEKSIITRKGDYVLSNMETDILTDASIREGWFYYYSTGTEEKVPWEEWKCADGMYTSCEILFDIQNLKKDMKETFIQRFTGVIAYNIDLKTVPDCASAEEFFKEIRETASKDKKSEIFEFTPLQRNPGQLDTDGYETRSKDAVLLKCNETAQQDIIADVSESFLRSWENSSGTEPMWAAFSYDEDTVYIVDLRTQMKELAD